MKKICLVPWSTFFLCIFLGIVVSSCYLPKDFALDIRLTQNGDYALRYEGDLIATNLRKKIRENNLNGEELAKELEIYRRDLARDNAFSKIEYIDDGIFRVKYVYVSNVGRQASYRFLRGDNRIFSIAFNRDKNIVTMEGRDFSERGRLSRLVADYQINGRVQIISDVTVLAHNADIVKEGKTPVYVWDIRKSKTETPSIVFVLE